MSKPDIVQSVDKACALLAELAHMGTASLAEITSTLDLPKSTVDRLCATLAARGFVERCEGGYRPGKALASLWAAYQLGQIRDLEAARKNLADTAIPDYVAAPAPAQEEPEAVNAEWSQA